VEVNDGWSRQAVPFTLVGNVSSVLGFCLIDAFSYGLATMGPKNSNLFNISSIHRNQDFGGHASNMSGKDFEARSARKQD
jgi:hypothetical protein